MTADEPLLLASKELPTEIICPLHNFLEIIIELRTTSSLPLVVVLLLAVIGCFELEMEPNRVENCSRSLPLVVLGLSLKLSEVVTWEHSATSFSIALLEIPEITASID